MVILCSCLADLLWSWFLFLFFFLLFVLIFLIIIFFLIFRQVLLVLSQSSLVLFLLLQIFVLVRFLGGIGECTPLLPSKLGNCRHRLSFTSLHELRTLLSKEDTIRTTSGLLRGVGVLFLLLFFTCLPLFSAKSCTTLCLLTTCSKEGGHVFVELRLCSFVLLLVHILLFCSDGLPLLASKLGNCRHRLSFTSLDELRTLLSEKDSPGTTRWPLGLLQSNWHVVC